VKTLAGILLAAAAATLALLPPRAAATEGGDGAARPVRGVLHVHTSRSDGTGSADAIAAAAARAGLQFVIFTDHGDASTEPTAPVYRGGVLCIDAVEISSDDGHILALGLPRLPFLAGGAGRDVLEDIARFGGLSILAHPTSTRRALRWTGGEQGFDGLEWLNGDSEWRDEPPLSLARAFLTYWVRPAETLASLLDRPEEALSLWDRTSASRAVIGVAAADAHARIGLSGVGEPYDGRPVARVPGYESVFRVFSLALPHLRLTGTASTDAAATIGEIRAGRVVSVLDALAAPASLQFSASTAAGEFEQGGVVPIGDGPITLRVRATSLPGARIRLLRDGREIGAGDTAAPLILEQAADAATYRVEVSLPGAPGQPPVPWMVSNPIFVGRDRQSWTEPAVTAWPGPRLPLYEDGPADAWAIERSAGADGRVEAAKATSGTQLSFRFALGGRRADNPFVAAARPLAGSVGGYEALLFEARASRPMRISAQLRARDAGDGRRWVRSVFLDETLRQVVLPFREFRPAGHDAALPPDDIGSVLFVVDGVHTALGQNGQLWFDRVALGAVAGAQRPQVRTESSR
jgi:hypothetical protein